MKNAFSLPIKGIIGQVGKKVADLTRDPILDLARRKGRESVRRTEKRLSVRVGSRPHHKELNVAFRPTLGLQRLARCLLHIATLALSRQIGGKVSVKVVRILNTKIGITKDASIVPGNAGNNSIPDINNGSEEWKDKALVDIVIHPQKTQTVKYIQKNEELCYIPNI
jgi:hypothetical protein